METTIQELKLKDELIDVQRMMHVKLEMKHEDLQKKYDDISAEADALLQKYNH